MRVAVGLRIGLDLCVPQECHCGSRKSRVDVRGVPSFVCKKVPGRTSRHHAFNDLIARAFSSAGFPVTKEPSDQMASGQMASHLFPGRAAKRYAGMSQ